MNHLKYVRICTISKKLLYYPLEKEVSSLDKLSNSNDQKDIFGNVTKMGEKTFGDQND